MNERRREVLPTPKVCYLVNKVKETAILIIKSKRGKPKTERTPEITAVVIESMRAAPSSSVHNHPQKLHISQTSFRRIFHKDLGMMPYKVQLV